jgi:aspartyl-tRNA(Asn)/glutamyl-tRNA(Gln) amidotransferase subunit A
MSDAIADMTLTAVADAIRRKKISSLEVTQGMLARIDRLQPQLNCFISVERDEVLKAARKADRALAQGANAGPLHGVPLAHKDMFYRAGKIATCGSKILRNERQQITATVVERLAGAGALWLGGLNMGEFASDPTGGNEHFGRCHNPWNTHYVTGGSSSGSASAVAARICHAALGSDTGGSIRTPAALCGVVGFKPTNGRVSTYGAMARAWSHDCVGPIARTVRDCARIARVISGADPRDPAASTEAVAHYEKQLRGSLKGLRIGVPENYFYDSVAADMQARMVESVAALKSLGARVVDITVPDPAHAFAMSVVMTECESATYHAEWMRTRPQDYSPGVRARFAPGLEVPAVNYIEAQNERARLRAEFLATVFARVDLLHTPVMPVPVPTIAATQSEDPDNLRALIPLFTRNTRTASFFSLPALSVPVGFTANGMPAAMQLIGRPFDEELVLRAGHAYQSVTDWHERAPPLSG